MCTVVFRGRKLFLTTSAQKIHVFLQIAPFCHILQIPPLSPPAFPHAMRRCDIHVTYYYINLSCISFSHLFSQYNLHYSNRTHLIHDFKYYIFHISNDMNNITSAFYGKRPCAHSAQLTAQQPQRSLELFQTKASEFHRIPSPQISRNFIISFSLNTILISICFI